MTTPPPPPPGNGPNQPYDPSGSAPPPPGQGGPGQGGPGQGQPPAYGSGQPPQAPPPGQGGAPQGGSDQTKILSFVSMGTGIAGLIICCCWGLPIFSVIALITGFIARNNTKTNPRPDLKTFILIGLITGAIGIVISILYWILYAVGAISFDSYSDIS